MVWGRNIHILAVAVVILLLAACGGGGSTSANDSLDAQVVNPGDELQSVSSVDAMAVGDIYLPAVADGAASIDFSGSSGDESYILMVQSASATPLSTTVSLASGNEAVPVKSGAGAFESDMEGFDDAAEIFHDKLRDVEHSLATLPPSMPISPSASGVGKAVGDGRSFKVLSSLTSSSSYSTVRGTVKCETDDVIVYVDDDVDTSDYAGYLDDDDIDMLCESFQTSYGMERTLIGDPSDLNSDGKVSVFLTPAVNLLGASGGGIITGFFYAADLYCSLGISNCTEVVYAVVPDPAGEFNVPLSKSFVMNNLLTAVIPHEMQHLISYNQHVFVNGGSAEANWLNEALSHLMEDIVGFGQENPSRYDLFLATPSTTSLIPSSSPNLVQRGASYMFLRYLYEQSADPDGFMQSLLQTSLTSVTNVETAFNGLDGFDEYEEFMLRWGIALALTNRGVTADSDYIYQDRSFNALTSHWQGVCVECSADDGRGTILDGVSLENYHTTSSLSLYSSAQKYYFISAGSHPDQVSISAGASSALQVVLMRIE